MSAWANSAPSKEYLLREEYPDLKEKWTVYQDYKHDFSDALTRLEKFGIIKRFFQSEEYNRVRTTWMEAKILYEDALKEYQILEKLLWDY